jgi:hypothetical protein
VDVFAKEKMLMIRLTACTSLIMSKAANAAKIGWTRHSEAATPYVRNALPFILHVIASAMNKLASTPTISCLTAAAFLA